MIYLDQLKKRFEKFDANTIIVTKNVTGAVIVKGFALIISFLTMPLYIDYFNDQKTLGIWFTLLSVLSWILTFDLGIGNGLRNYLTDSITNRKFSEAKKYITAAYFSISFFSFIIIVLFNILFKYINWNTVLNIDSLIITQETLLLTIRIVFTGIMIQFILKLITSILYALQRSSINNFLSLCSSIIIFAAVLYIPRVTPENSLISMAWINVFAVNIPLLFTTIIVFSNKLKYAIPSINTFEKKYMVRVLRLGGSFFYVQIVYMLIGATNEYMITYFSDSAFVVEYQIYYKLFLLGSTIFALALTPMWSATTKAFAEKNYTWLKKSYNSMCLMALVATLFQFSIIPFLKPIVKLWLGNDAIVINYGYAIAFAIMGSLIIWNGVISTIANGVGKLQTQAIFYTIGIIIKVPIAIIILNITNMWIAVVISQIVALLPYCIIQPFWINRFFKNRV